MSYTVDEYRREVSNKKILVVGMGRSGMAAVKELHALGVDSNSTGHNTVEKIDPKFITFLDREGIEYYLDQRQSIWAVLTSSCLVRE